MVLFPYSQFHYKHPKAIAHNVGIISSAANQPEQECTLKKGNKTLKISNIALLYNLMHVPKVLHKLCKCLSSSSKRNNNVNDRSRNIDRFTLHFHEGSKRSEQGDMPVLHAIHLLIKQLILCPLISFCTIVT